MDAYGLVEKKPQASSQEPEERPSAAPSRCAPGEGWVNGEQAMEMFDVGSWTWNKWLKEGRIRCGEAIGPSGRFKRYRIEELRREIEALRRPQPFPPPGMIDEKTARQMFGIGTWVWDKWRKDGTLRCGQWVLIPGGGRTKLYPVEELRRIVEQFRAFPPPGMLTGDDAAQMFGVSPLTWKNWVAQGKVRFGRRAAIPTGGMCYLYAEEDLQKLMEEMRGPDKAYWDPQNPGFYRVPPGYIRQKQAWRMFGVDKATWKRWEREKQITCGRRVHRGGPKLYKIEDLNRLLEEYGRYAPPYPDPDRAGVYRVPLSGHDIKRREAIIDAADLPLVQGRRWGWNAPTDDVGIGIVTHSKQGDTAPLHRIIMGVTDPELQVMHRNDVPLDCRRENLVVRTKSEVSAAARKARTYCGRPCTSKFKGVCWDKDRELWVAQIKAEGRHRMIGRFDDEIAAAEAYDEAAATAWGEHARLNFPDGVDAYLEREARQSEEPRREAA